MNGIDVLVNNDVHICFDCGTKEAINDMIGVSFDKNSWYKSRKG